MSGLFCSYLYIYYLFDVAHIHTLLFQPSPLSVLLSGVCVALPCSVPPLQCIWSYQCDETMNCGQHMYVCTYVWTNRWDGSNIDLDVDSRHPKMKVLFLCMTITRSVHKIGTHGLSFVQNVKRLIIFQLLCTYFL